MTDTTTLAITSPDALALPNILAIFAEGISPRTLREARKALREAYPAGNPYVAMTAVPQKDGTLADEAPYRASNLFSAALSNTKLALSDALTDRYETIGLSLAPAAQNGLRTVKGSLISFCSHASKVCLSICLFGTGHARVSKGVRRARVGKSRLWIKHQDWFKARMLVEVASHQLAAEKRGRQLVVRLNVFSDLLWEEEFPELFTTFPSVQWYDYTKIPGRVGNTPANYHLTFSRSERRGNEVLCLEYLRTGAANVAVVFENHDFPATWNGYPVIDGTTHDLRFTDPQGVIVGLAEKNTELKGPNFAGKRNMANKTAGFVLPTITSNAHGQPMPSL